MTKPELRLLVTGGTIDKYYDEISGKMVFSEQSYLPAMIEQARSKGSLALQTLMLKDSLNMDDEDRAIVANACEEAEEDRIVITHGTDTMVETGLAIKRLHLPKTIVLTGAMIPYTQGVRSDAQFNLGTAIAYAQVSPIGTYVAMNGQRFDIDNVRKDKPIGEFETK
ncbi:MAG: asparaginase domain-containing protein [Patescibacteria group bacterium]